MDERKMVDEVDDMDAAWKRPGAGWPFVQKVHPVHFVHFVH
jgi:hypothetical protein